VSAPTSWPGDQRRRCRGLRGRGRTGSGAERKLTVDRDGAIKLLHAARAADVERYVMVSSIGAEDPPDGDDVFAVYLRAKAEADRELMASDRAWTVVRPVFLQDEQGTGRVRLAEQPLRGEVPRDDVAGVLAAVLHEPRSARRVLYVSAGDATRRAGARAACCDPAGRNGPLRARLAAVSWRTSAIATPTSVASISVQIASAGSEAPSAAVAITTTSATARGCQRSR
jgi:uncharacterized protein YbjT (DUF2867 family)